MATIVDSNMYGNNVASASNDGGESGGGSSNNAINEPSHDAVRQTLRDVISRDSFDEIRRVVRDIEKLNKMERLFLYLELPSSLSNLSDPLRQPLNPLGSRYEIQLTITWIKTHLEEDPQVSLPKHEVYDDYLEYCNANSLKPLSTADFGKVMKQVYPQVRPRRLGTRGNSRYCYAGLKKKLKLDEPTTPECGGGKTVQLANDLEDEINSSASFLIREWVEKLLGVKFNSLRDLALYLIEKMYVDNRSAAAYTVITTMAKSNEVTDTKPPSMRKPEGILVNGNNQSVENSYEQKRKIELPVNADLAIGKRASLKRSKLIMGEDNYMDVKSPNDGDIPHDKELANDFSQFDDDCIPSRQFLHDTFKDHDKLDVVKDPSSWGDDNVPVSVAASSSDTQHMDCIKPWDLERKDTLDDDELGNYFKEGSSSSGNLPSAESDENHQIKLSQLRQLLEKNLKSPTVAMTSSAFKPAPRNTMEVVKSEQNTWDTYPASDSSMGAANNDHVMAVVVSSESQQQPQQQQIQTTSNSNSSSSSLSHRRRVSFNPLIVQDPPPAAAIVSSSSCTTTATGSLAPGQSPGTRKRHFSFQPISPRQASLPQSPLASPFISPRSTPVHMMRSRHSSGSALPLHLLPQGQGQPGSGVQQKGPFGSSGSDISRAATFGSASECSTPFISPHGTPIPFNRSRHNSAQGRLCSRSRHSSGVGVTIAPYRYNMTPFSPMALNNLNNPYSPQPATPVGGSGEELFVGVAPNVYVVDHGQGGQLQGNNVVEVVSNQNMHHHLDDDRSRHSSAESDPNNVRSAPMSPHHSMTSEMYKQDHQHHHQQQQQHLHHQIHTSRMRHQSAGNQPNSSLAPLKPSEWMHESSLASDNHPVVVDLHDHEGGQGQGQGGFDRRSQSVPVVGQLPTTTSSSEYGMAQFSDMGFRKETSTSQKPEDDLDMALSALKDCDNDFSKFIQDVENNGN